MGSSSKRQTTMAKMARERRLQEKRERKAEKKEARKLAAAQGLDPDASWMAIPTCAATSTVRPSRPRATSRPERGAELAQARPHPDGRDSPGRAT